MTQLLLHITFIDFGRGGETSPQRVSGEELATSVLGAMFLGGQIYEFTEFVREGLGFTSNVSASAFFTLTGLHGAHVAVGVLMLLSASVYSVRRQLNAEAVETLGLYWHFVDIVWVVIFAIVYLIP